MNDTRKRHLPLVWFISEGWFRNIFDDLAEELGVPVEDLTVEQKELAVLNKTLKVGRELIDAQQ